jgi:hypothetical protein
VWLVLISAAVFYGTPRFRVPAEPTVVVLAAVGISALAARPRSPTTGLAATRRLTNVAGIYT